MRHAKTSVPEPAPVRVQPDCSAARYWCGVEMSEQYVIEWAIAIGWKPATACSVHDAISILREWGHKITILAPPNAEVSHE